jgi:hypothetical protein
MARVAIMVTLVEPDNATIVSEEFNAEDVNDTVRPNAVPEGSSIEAMPSMDAEVVTAVAALG